MADTPEIPKESLVRHGNLLDRITDAVFAFDTDWCFTYLNEPAESMHGQPASELVGQCVWEVYPEASKSEFYDRYHEAMERQEQLSVKNYFEAWDCWYEEHLYPSTDGLLVVSRDVTEVVESRHRLSNTSVLLRVPRI